MGCTGSSEERKERQANINIEHKYNTDNERERKIYKLLLLGSGESGKSTLFRHLSWLYGEENELNVNEGKTRLYSIRENMVHGIAILLRKSHELYGIDDSKYSECFIDLEKSESKIIIENVKIVASFQQETFDPNESSITPENLELLGKAMYDIWLLPGIQETFKHRDQYSFSDNMDYFYGKTIEIFKSDYVVNKQDFLRSRVRTTSISSINIKTNDGGSVNKFTITDVGGQRNERSKWIHQFDGVTAVIYMTALNHYASVLFEDEMMNAMHESLNLFAEVAKLDAFTKASMIVFLNKYDLFIDTLNSGKNLGKCFNSSINTNWPTNDEQWNINDKEINYDPTRYIDDEKSDEEYFQNCENKAVEFIKLKFTERSPKNKRPYCHVTNACDKDIIRKVFWDVQHIVVQGHLSIGGLNL